MPADLHRCTLLLAVLALPWVVAEVRADGGALRLSEQRGPYRISVFTAPTPLRAGPVDVSVLVQDPGNGEVIPDVRVSMRAVPAGGGEAIECRATHAAATNQLFQAAVFELPEAGEWQVEVAVDGAKGVARSAFTVAAAGPMPRWLALWPWWGWPLPVAVLFGVHQWLARRRR